MYICIIKHNDKFRFLYEYKTSTGNTRIGTYELNLSSLKQMINGEKPEWAMPIKDAERLLKRFNRYRKNIYYEHYEGTPFLRRLSKLEKLNLKNLKIF
jgi:hypothetical protein